MEGPDALHSDASQPGANEFLVDRMVEFRDTDAAGIVHFSAFFTFMEEAEHAFLRSLGWSVSQEHEGKWISWPRVAAHCNYRSPLRFEQAFQIGVCVLRLGGKSIRYGFRFLGQEGVVAEGELTVVCCQMMGKGEFKSMEIPDSFRSCLAAFVQKTPS